MVATLATLRLRLLRNTLTRETWRLILAILGALYGLGLLGMLLFAAVFSRDQAVEDITLVAVTAGSLLTLGWAMIPLLAFGVDDSLDPQRFVLFTQPNRRFALGLMVAGAISLPGLFTALGLLVVTPVWSRSALATVGWLIGSTLGLATCVLLSRVTTGAAASRLRSRRGRDVTAIIGALVFLPLALLPRAVESLDGGSFADVLRPAVEVLGWTPLGSSWAVAADFAAGTWLLGLARLLAATGWVMLLFWWWHRLLHQIMTTPPVAADRSAARPQRGQFPPRVIAALRLPEPTAAIAARAARYWRRDPRYIASAVSLAAIGPIIVVVFGGVGVVSLDSWFVLLAPPLAAGFAGWSLHNDTAYDSTAWWLHVSSGVPGWMDRAGRVVGALLWMAPFVVLFSVAACALTARWAALPAVLGASFGLLLAGLAVSMIASAVVVYPVPPPGASPFSTSSMGAVGLTMLAQGVTSVATLVLASPAIVFGALGVLLAPVWGWISLATGIIGGGLCLIFGVRLAGRRLVFSQARHLHTMRGWSGH